MTRLLALLVCTSAATAQTVKLDYAPAPADNPLKGLVPYAGDVRSRFPHSLEFDYLPLSAVVVGESRYDWQPLEKLLDAIAGRGHQAVFRIYLEYPAKSNVIPAYLVRGGLKVHKYKNTNTAPLPPAEVETPDYEDANLRACLKNFIRELGKKYDGDPRIGFITAGLLGTWGEWHTYPRSELFASKAVQAEVMDAYEAAFRTTPVLLRYPAGEKAYAHAANAGRRFGYHDDSFAWATLDTGKADDDWFYMPALKAAGPKALDKWKTQPIGGEIRPEAWGKVFDEKPGVKEIQDFRTCVETTHATWLMDSGMFEKKQPKARIARATEQVQRMGYEFHVPTASFAVDGRSLTVQATQTNRGVAPFYYPWPATFGVLAADGTLTPVLTKHLLTGIFPDDPARVWIQVIDVSGVPAGPVKVLVRVSNSLPNGHPVRFANTTQDADRPGWLTLGTVNVR